MKAKFVLTTPDVEKLLGVPGRITRFAVLDDPHVLVVHVQTDDLPTELCAADYQAPKSESPILYKHKLTGWPQ